MAVTAVFLDKDGTLIRDVPYNVDPDLIELAPGVEAGLPLLAAAGYLLIVVTNQSGVGRGYFPESALRAVEARLRKLLPVELADFYYCSHTPAGGCDCRKPQPGLPRQAALDHDLDLSRSWLIGDILNDVEAGRRCGCRTILIDNGNETEWRGGPLREPDYVASDLMDAAGCILHAGAPKDTERPRASSDRMDASSGILQARAAPHGWMDVR